MIFANTTQGKLIKTVGFAIWSQRKVMDSSNEAVEQLNRAERFLTEIQDNPEVTSQNFLISS